MTAFLRSVKTDLQTVRLRLAVILLAIAVVAAVAYAVLGEGGSSATAPTLPAPISTGVAGIAVSKTPANPEQPVAETSNGSSQQRSGASRNPFTPLPAAAVKSVATTGTTGSSTASSGSSTTSTQTTTPATPAKPSAPATPKAPALIYHVAVLFGVAPPGTPPQSLQLTPYENLGRLQALPSSKQPLLVFRGVTTGGGRATFTLIGEAILHGPATCLPSPSQCQAIELKPKQTEELEYLPPSGQAVTYQLQVVSISSSKASAARTASVFHAESKPGRELLRRMGLTALPGLRYSPERGVLVVAVQRPGRGR